jgi:hypothetical protein
MEMMENENAYAYYVCILQFPISQYCKMKVKDIRMR